MSEVTKDWMSKNGFGEDVNKATAGDVPLFMALHTKQYDIAKDLVENGGAQVDGRGSVHSSDTPLMKAAYDANPDMVQFLLDRGANPNLAKWNNTAMLSACSVGGGTHENKKTIIDALKAKGGDVNAGAYCDGPRCLRPMHHAAADGCWQCVDALKASGGDVNARDRADNTPLHWAADRVFAESVDDYRATLDALKAGQPLPDFVNAKNDKGNTPLDIVTGSTGVDAFINALKAAGGKRGSELP